MAGRRSTTARSSPSGASPRGSHFLPSGLAARIVRDSDIHHDELVFDLGAGAGALTGPLARTGARVIAVERDDQLVRRLQRRFARADSVRVVHGDIRQVPLPRRSFRVVANLPFGVTTAVLSRLLHGGSGLAAADLVVADGVCRALAAPRPGNPRTLGWSVRWELTAGRRLPARCFSPPPSVDARLLVVRRRTTDLVTGEARRAFDEMVAAAYRRPGERWADAAALLLSYRQLTRVARGRQLDRDASADRLTVEDWAALARIVAGDE